jgi:hypothetical protein
VELVHRRFIEGKSFSPDERFVWKMKKLDIAELQRAAS